MKKAIVISAVNIRKGGTLTILRDCLRYLSESDLAERYRIIALVHDKALAFYPDIEYIEYPDTVKSWGKRLWCEYVSMRVLSEKLAPVYLWFSLHDTTPNVVAERHAVYCQTSFPFLKPKWRDLTFDYKIVLFSFLTRFAYQINIKKNNFLVVQTAWLRKGLADMFGLDENRFIVAPPERNVNVVQTPGVGDSCGCKTFFFPSTPDCHKNFEVLCEAARMLETEVGKGKFRVVITISGKENRYSGWLYRKWGNVDSICFAGFLSRDVLYEYYSTVDCLVFPSRVETWGLPISEFSTFGKPVLLADLPYAHETAQGMKNVCFFNSSDSQELKKKMKNVVFGDMADFSEVNKNTRTGLYADTWHELFEKLLVN